jgi:hypothetical protein
LSNLSIVQIVAREAQKVLAKMVLEQKPPIELQQRLTKGVCDWEALMRLVNEHFDILDRIAEEENFSRRRALLDEKPDPIKKRRDELLAQFDPPKNLAEEIAAAIRMCDEDEAAKVISQAIELQILSICGPSLSKANILEDRAVVVSDLAEVAMALAAYKAAEGEYPEKLSALVPAYFETVPQDRYANQPLKYKRTDDGYLLYSIGDNLEDDGGVEERDGEYDLDIVVSTAEED